MAFKDIWQDLEDAVEGVAGSGSDVSVEPINKIAHAVIENETALESKADASAIGDISTALDELHAYAQALVGGAE